MTTRRRFLGGAASLSIGAVAGCLSPRQVDHAAYSTPGDTLPDVDYEAVKERAAAAEYTVDGPYYVNAKRELGRQLDVPALVDRFGADARVVLAQLRYSETRFFDADFTRQQEGVRLVFFDDALAYGQPFRPTNLPPDDWLTAQFTVLFDMSGSDAATLLADVKAAAAETDDNLVTEQVESEPDLSAVHRSFEDRATTTTTSETGGDGWANHAFLEDDRELGRFSVVVPSVRIVTTDDSHEYRIKLDRLGGFNLAVLLDPGETMPESEYRGVFRRMFGALGLPAERVDEYEFEYTPSNW